MAGAVSMSSPKEVGIIVMGLTGAGKSAYISRLTEQNVDIGHSLRSCTTNVYGYPYRRSNGQRVWLIDTPGFDDTNKANPSILREIVSFLCGFGDDENLVIGGLLYIHRISDVRMAGSSVASLRIFEALCGESSFEDVTVVTTMWDTLQTEAARDQAQDRELALQHEENFFGRLKSKGARFARSSHDGTSDSNIIDTIADRQKSVKLGVQMEMMPDSNVKLADTTVGRFLYGNLQTSRQRLEKRLNQVEAQNTEDQGDNADLIADIRKQISHLAGAPECLNVTYEELKRERKAKFEADLAQDVEGELQTAKSAKELMLEQEIEMIKQESDFHYRSQREWDINRDRELAQQHAQIQDLEDDLAYEKAQRNNKTRKTTLWDFFLGRTSKAPLTNNEDIPPTQGEGKEPRPRESRRNRSKKPRQQQDSRAIDLAFRASLPYSAVGHAMPDAINPRSAQMSINGAFPTYEQSVVTAATVSSPQNHTRDAARPDNGGFDAYVAVDPKKIKRNYSWSSTPSSPALTRTVPVHEQQKNPSRF